MKKRVLGSRALLRHHSTHPLVGVAGEPVLKAACDWIAKLRHPIPRFRNRFELIVDVKGVWVESQQKSLFALFDVIRSRFVDKAKSVCVLGNRDNPADIQGPESKRINLYCYNLTVFNGRIWVCDFHPAKIELPPLSKGVNCRFV